MKNCYPYTNTESQILSGLTVHKRWKKITDYKHEDIKFDVHVGLDGHPILNVYLKDGRWFPVPFDTVRVSKVHPNFYEKVWGEPMPVISSTIKHSKRIPVSKQSEVKE